MLFIFTTFLNFFMVFVWLMNRLLRLLLLVILSLSLCPIQKYAPHLRNFRETLSGGEAQKGRERSANARALRGTRGPLDVMEMQGPALYDGDIEQRSKAKERRPRKRSRHAISAVKRIMLVRRYRHQNVYKDLGIRVTGGRRLANGELGAFITAFDPNVLGAGPNSEETLEEIQVGDQVLEWNGILLSGKTFEEVDRIISGCQGEIEVVLGGRKDSQDSTCYGDGCARGAEKYRYSTRISTPPPGATGRTFEYRALDNASACGDLQVALDYDQLRNLLLVEVLRARGLKCRVYPPKETLLIPPNPLVQVDLLPSSSKNDGRRTTQLFSTQEPVWNARIEFCVGMEELLQRSLALTVWDYDKYNGEHALGQLLLELGDPSLTFNAPQWYALQTAAKPPFYPNKSSHTSQRYSAMENSQHLNYNSVEPEEARGYPAIV